MPFRSPNKQGEKIHAFQGAINDVDHNSLFSSHHTNNAINGLVDEMSDLLKIDVISDVNDNKASKSTASDELSLANYIGSLEKNCNRCGMVWPKKKSMCQSTLGQSDSDQEIVHSNDLSRAENDSFNGESEAKEIPSLITNGVKSRVLFFEKGVEMGTRIRPVKSLPNLRSHCRPKETEAQLLHTETCQDERPNFRKRVEASLKVGSPSLPAKAVIWQFEEADPKAEAEHTPVVSLVNAIDKAHDSDQGPTGSFGAVLSAKSNSVGCPFSGQSKLKTIRLKNYVKESQHNDTLHVKAQEAHCSRSRCMGSLMQPYGGGEERPYGVARSKEEVKEHAVRFLSEYYAHTKRQDADDHKQRLQEVMQEIERNGTYDLHYDELTFGAKLAWRNAPRCIGRIQWNNLKVFDRRSMTTAEEMFGAICEHLDYATNMGNLRSTISIFRERRDGLKDWRIWNSQLIRYAGYEQKDGSVIGDPASVDFTKLCIKLGWKGYGGHFDVLPLIIEAGGEAPRLFEIPDHLVLEVKIKHPQYSWFEDLGLQWYALPAVANMKLDIGGVEFPFSPFNGWYMVTEIGARDLGDSARYNMLEPIAKKMNLDTRSPASLWKDRAVTELNQAVLYSFQEAKVTLVDHHTASDSFIKHMENEQKLRGGCPADWVWIVPPSSGSTTEVFHQEMLNYSIKPSYDYQDDAWRYYQFADEIGLKKLTFKQAASFVRTTNILMRSITSKREKATVLYATETGKSEDFAQTLASMLSRVFDVKIFCMNEYKFSDLHKEKLLMIVTSTFGNGESPMNGEEFSDKLYKLGQSYSSSPEASDNNTESKLLTSLKFAVFGLGSSAYPNFCAFAHFCRSILKSLGAKEINPLGEGDELSGQEESFNNWANEVFQASCDSCSIDQSQLSPESDTTRRKEAFSPKHYGFTYGEGKQELDTLKGLSALHSKEMQCLKILSVEELQAESSSRSTVLVKLDKGGKASMNFEPGDHIAVCPSNDQAMVESLIQRLQEAPRPDTPIRIKKLVEGSAEPTSFQRLQQGCSLRQALTHFVDITSPPSQEVLKSFAQLARDKEDIKELENLSKNKKDYEKWKIDNYPTIADILEDFPSLKLNGIDLLLLLPVLQYRYYSISSSPLMYGNEIHATVAVVRYETQGKTRRIHNGVCSYWMSRLKPGNLVPCFIRKATSFKMPVDLQAPIIMVGPGTGIAPFRSFWQHRQMLRAAEGHKGVKWGSMDLYAGCRRFKEDNIYSEEKQHVLNDGVLDHAYLALSRESKLRKTYVQNMILRHAEDVCKKLTVCSGHIYVCGDVAMAADVNGTLCKILQNQLDLPKDKAKEFLKGLKSSGHYHEDIFGVTKIHKRPREDHILREIGPDCL